MPRLGRRVEPVVVAPVHIPHRGCGELGRVEIVEHGEIDGHIGAADLRNVAMAESGDAAVAAEAVMRLARAELVVGERPLPFDEPKGLGLDHRAPVAALPADGAVALARAGGEVDIGLEAHLTAMAAAVVGFEHGGCLIVEALGANRTR